MPVVDSTVLTVLTQMMAQMRYSCGSDISFYPFDDVSCGVGALGSLLPTVSNFALWSAMDHTCFARNLSRQPVGHRSFRRQGGTAAVLEKKKRRNSSANSRKLRRCDTAVCRVRHLSPPFPC